MSDDPNFRLDETGAMHTRDGLAGFPEQGVWAADDRILAFCSQPSGGLSQLVFHGRQPQSANAFLLQNPAGALLLTLDVETGGRVEPVRHRFQETLVWPYGWENTFQAAGLRVESKLCARGRELVWQVRCRNRRAEALRVTPVLTLDPAALTTRVNGQRTWREPAYADGALHLAARDQLQTRTWIDTPGFRDVFIDAETFLLIGGQHADDRAENYAVQLGAEEIAPGEWGDPRYFLIACHPVEAAAQAALAGLREDPQAPFRQQAARYARRIAQRPGLHVEGYPVAEAAFRLAPLYAEATKVHGSGALRSSAGGHYFVWGWDNLMGGHELTHWGDAAGARALLDFIAGHPAEDGCVPHRFDNDLQPLQVTGYDFISQLFISLLHQYYSETLDGETLQRHFPVAERIFNALAARAGSNGFYRALGMYPDAPEKLERTADSLVAYENGFWYCACRMMEVLAKRSGAPEAAARAAGLAARMESAYAETFFDPQAGFVVDALVGPEDAPNGSYPRYSLFPLHNPFGAWLLRPLRGALSRFTRDELFKADGIRMVPEWDRHVGTETVTRSCWFLHFDLYSLKAFRRAGDGAAIQDWLRLADDYYRRRRVIPELQMLSASGETGARWSGVTGQIWQLFALSGWTRGLLEGVLGLESDIGGLTYIPCALEEEMHLKDFPFRGGRWEVNVSGQGGWVERLAVDGVPVSGCLKVPAEHYSAAPHRLEIVRGAKPPTQPCLLEAVGAAVSAPYYSGQRLTLELQAENRVDLVFFCPARPHVRVDGREIPAQWDAHSQTGSLSLPVNGKATFSLEPRQNE